MNFKMTHSFRASMKHCLSCLVLALLVSCGSGNYNLDAAGNPIDSASLPDTSVVNTYGTPQSFTLKSASVDRTYLVYAPRGLPTTLVPVVIMLHAEASSSEEALLSTTESKWNAIADRDKIIVVYPQALSASASNSRTLWNDCRNDKFAASTADDVTFISEMIAALAARYTIDQKRVYASGHSNGGMMALRLAAELPAKVAAVHSNAGLAAANSQCTAATGKQVGVMISAGTADLLMPFEGGSVKERASAGAAVNGTVLSAVATVEAWRIINQTSAAPVTTDITNSNITDESTITSFSYTAPFNGSGVLLLKVVGGGHGWPSATQFSAADQIELGKKNQDIDMSEEAWKFLKIHNQRN
jgi:polyhydroxybutyrate depolymerase